MHSLSREIQPSVNWSLHWEILERKNLRNLRRFGDTGFGFSD